jgi:hypothetical protein
MIKRLKTNLPPKIAPGSGVEGIVYLETLNPPRYFPVKSAHILAVHKVVGYIPSGRVRGEDPDERDILPIQ